MLCPGIKLGPEGWRDRLEESAARHVEVWYRADTPERYTEMFRVLRERRVRFGLHFWGMHPSGHEPNLAYPGPERPLALELVRSCIDAAASSGADYVNLHTGNRCQCIVDFGNQLLFPDPCSPVISNEESAALRNQALRELGTEALGRDVRLLVESIPAKLQSGDFRQHKSLSDPLESYPTGLSGLLELMKEGVIGFTNDLCHVFAMGYDEPREILAEKARSLSEHFAPYTRVAHINALTPPYRGTDEHLGILAEDLSLPGVYPTKPELQEFFSLLKNQRHDIWLIGEPKSHHLENYRALLGLLEDADSSSAAID